MYSHLTCTGILHAAYMHSGFKPSVLLCSVTAAFTHSHTALGTSPNLQRVYFTGTFTPSTLYALACNGHSHSLNSRLQARLGRPASRPRASLSITQPCRQMCAKASLSGLLKHTALRSEICARRCGVCETHGVSGHLRLICVCGPVHVMCCSQSRSLSTPTYVHRQQTHSHKGLCVHGQRAMLPTQERAMRTRESQ